jgi:Family of unknown function (DUF5895)
MTNAITVPDFTDSQYDDLTIAKPRLTALRGSNDTNFGFFTTMQDVGKCEWVNFDPSKVITYHYDTGGKEEGLLFQDPTMLVLPTSPLLAIDKAKTKEQKRMVCCEYDRAKHSERAAWDTGRAFDVILLGKDLNPLHLLPFEMILKGAAQATFHSAWVSSCQRIARIYCQDVGKIYKPKDDRFNKLCVFRPIVTRRLVGGEQKSYSLVVDSFVQPEAIDDSFLGTVKHYEIANQLLVINRNAPLALMAAAESAEDEADDGVADAQLIPEPPEQTAELEGLKRSLVEKGDMLGWAQAKRKGWAFARHDCNSGNWTLQQWQEANDDLQELIDAHSMPVLEASAS